MAFGRSSPDSDATGPPWSLSQLDPQTGFHSLRPLEPGPSAPGLPLLCFWGHARSGRAAAPLPSPPLPGAPILAAACWRHTWGDSCASGFVTFQPAGNPSLPKGQDHRSCFSRANLSLYLLSGSLGSCLSTPASASPSFCEQVTKRECTRVGGAPAAGSVLGRRRLRSKSHGSERLSRPARKPGAPGRAPCSGQFVLMLLTTPG